MADQTITPISLATRDTASAAIAVANLTAANDGVITPTSDKLALYVLDAGGAGGTVIVKAGTEGALHGQGDLTITLGASEAMVVQLQSSRFKALSGTDKGKIRLDCSVNVSAFALAL